ncbi:MAG: M48 family metalloprotease [Pseudomonadota bacterium]|nr:M48 family metalloprotease [Pseudomonadota bacterium]
MKRSWLLLSSFVLSFLYYGCAVNPVSGNQDFVLMSENQEIAMGKRYNAEVLKQIPVYSDNELQQYVQALGESLAKNSHRSNLIYRFTVLDSPDVNAFALPGGYIFIYRGLMAYLSSEEELAAVLGHELGHVTARHSVQQISQSQLFDILTTIVGGVGGQSNSTAYNITNLAKGAFLAGYGRKLELQADELGAEYMALDGYSTEGMLKTLSVLKDQEVYSKEVSKRRGQTQTYHGVFASHPKNDKRFQEVISRAEVLKEDSSKDPVGNYLNKIEGLVFGDNEASGVRRGRDFYHSSLDLHLQAPKNWEIINTSRRLIFSSPDGEGYLALEVEDQNMRESPREYLKRNFSKNIYEAEDLLLDNYEASKTIIYSANERVRVAAVYKDRKVFTFIGRTRNFEKDFSSLDKGFVEIINSFSRLKNEEIPLSLPLRIRSYKVNQGDTYNSLYLRSHIPYDPEDKLRFLNGDYNKGKITT